MKLYDPVIIGGLHHNTLGVIRSLGESGIDKNCIHVLVIGHGIARNNILSKSKYVVADNVDYVENNDDIVDWLINLSHNKKKRIIICCSDGASEAVIKKYDILHEWYELPFLGCDIEQLMSKETQSAIAEECGLNVPIYKVIKTNGPVDWNLFPCITKPIKSVVGGGKTDIHISQNVTELCDALEHTVAEQVQIQQLVSKRMEYQLIGCSLENGDKIIIPGFTEIIRQPDNTNTGYLLYSPIEKLEYDKVAVEKFIKRISYNGLFSVEFVRDRHGIDYFLEINLRNDGNAYCVKSAGINLPYIWCYYQTNGSIPDVSLSFEKSIYFMPEFNDIKRGIKAVGFIQWFNQFMHAESHAIINLKDMAPFWMKIGDIVHGIVVRR